MTCIDQKGKTIACTCGLEQIYSNRMTYLGDFEILFPLEYTKILQNKYGVYWNNIHTVIVDGVSILISQCIYA